MSPNSLSIRILGPPSVTTSDGLTVEGLGPGKPLGMLAYIVVNGEVRREQLISLFWSDLPEEKARNAFRQTLHRLRKALGESLETRGPSTLALQIGDRISADVTAFESALHRGAFNEALSLYHGPFLEGFDLGERDFDQWVLGERARLEARYQWALEQGISAANAAGDTRDALAKAALLTKSAPLAAGSALTEAALLIAAGRTAEARSNLERFTERYRAEFDEDPPHEIRESLGRLRKEPGGGPASSIAAARRVLLGRDGELSRLLGVWSDTREGHGNLVLVAGQEGIGKSAIVDEFLWRVSKIGPMLRLVGRERSNGAMLPYASIGQALRGVLNAPGLAGASQHLLAEAARLLPELRDQFDLPALGNAGDEASQLRFYEGVAALIDAVAYEQPVCLVLEDFHGASPTTIRLVEYLCGRLASVSVAIVIVFRPDPGLSSGAVGFPFSLRDSTDGKGGSDYSIPVTRLDVGPLKRDEASALARSIADEDVLPAEECERIAALSAGVPFRILDLARQAAGGLRISALPATLQESLWARLQGCSPLQQRLFVASALIERPASIKLLAGASHLSESAAFDAVLSLEARGLLRQSPQGVAPEHHESALLALKGTGPAGRALLAGWAAEALEGEPDAMHAELAHLFSIAGNSRECLKHTIAAAYDAAALGEKNSVAHFLNLATETATTPADRAKVESMRRLFEPETRRLVSGEQAKLTDPDVEEQTAAVTGERSRSTAPAAMLSVRSLLVLLARSDPVRITAAVTFGVGLALLGLTANRARTGIKGPVVPDTLFLVNRSAQTPTLFYLAGEMGPGTPSPQPYVGRTVATWMDSIALPLMNPVASPAGALVAVEKMHESGPDIFLYSANGTIYKGIATENGDDIIAGWSPDGSWLLATHGRSLADGNYDADLFAISSDGNRRLALDISPSRSVVDAVWSPDGTHIAWTARVGRTHQQEVYVANADGTGLINVSNSEEEDYHIVWAPDGGRIAFTSNRFGNADIFAYELSTKKLWRLTGTPGQEDYAAFSPDGNFVAFESTAEGVSSVFIVRSWGGNPVLVAGGDQSYTVSRWGQPRIASSYVSKISIVAPSHVPIAQTVTAEVEAIGVNSMRMIPSAVKWMNLDPALLEMTLDARDEESGVAYARLTGVKAGLARVGISASGWRADTALVRVGNSRIDLISEDFTSGFNERKWMAVGDSAPRAIQIGNGMELSAKSGRQRESGVLSRTKLPLYNGFFAQVAVRAPLTAPTAQRTFSISLVIPDSTGTMTQARAQTRIATVEWIGQAARIAYSVDRETWTEPVGLLGNQDAHVFELSIDDDGKVAFSADGKQRWKSRLRIPRAGIPARLWLGSQGSSDRVTFDNVRVGLKPVTTGQ